MKILISKFGLVLATFSLTTAGFQWSSWHLTQASKQALSIFDASEPILDLTQIPDHLLTSYAKFNYAQEQKLAKKLGLRIEDGGKVLGQAFSVILNASEGSVLKPATDSSLIAQNDKVVVQEITKVVREINNYTVKASLTESELITLVSQSQVLQDLLRGPKGDPGITLGYTLPSSSNTNSMGTIAGFTHLSGQDLSAQTLNVTQTLTIASAVSSTFEGNLTVKGNTTLGDASTDLTIINGNVGIGTTAPVGTLDLRGGVATSGVGAPIILSAQKGAASNNGGNIIFNSGENGSGASNGYIAFGTGSSFTGSNLTTERLRISTNGLIGIGGESAPASTVEIRQASTGTGFGGTNGVGALRISFSSGYGIGIDSWDSGTPRWGILNFSGDTPTVMMEGLYSSTNVIFNSGGNVGIGTTGPSSKLDVTTVGLGVTQTTSSGLALVNTTAAAAGAQQISPAIRWSGLGWKTDATAASQAVDFRSYVVPVQGTANPTGYLSFGSSVNGAAYNDGQLVLTTGGNVGIGTTNPGGNYTDAATRQLTIFDTGTGRVGLSLVSDPASTGDPIGIVAFLNEDSSNTAGRGGPRILGMRGTTDNSGYLRFDVANNGDSAPVMMINQAGNASFGGYAAAGGAGSVILGNENSITGSGDSGVGYIQGPNGNYLRIEGQGNGLIKSLTIWNNTGSGSAVNVDSSGILYRVSSALKYKKNVEDLEGGLSEVLQLRPVTYEEKARPEAGRFVGFIADEVVNVFPELVSYGLDGQIEGLMYDRLTGPIVNAIKELNAKLTVLETTSGQIAPEDSSSSISLSNIKDIVSISGKWSINENGVFVAKEVRTDKLCIGSTCVTEPQLQTLLQNNGLLINDEQPTTPNQTEQGSDGMGQQTNDGDVAGESTETENSVQSAEETQSELQAEQEPGTTLESAAEETAP